MVASYPRWLWLPAALGLGTALALGLLAATAPKLAIGLPLVALVMALALYAPVAHLVLLLTVTAIVPLSIQNQFSLGGGIDSPGIGAFDLLLFTGLIRAALILPGYPLDRRRLRAGAIVLVFLGVVALQFLSGLHLGRGASEAAAEARTLFGFATVLLALPSVGERKAFDRLLKGLVFVGLALGLWGLAQWVLQIDFGGTGDFGVREGVRYAAGGRGQIQGGLFGFPVAMLLAASVLVSGALHSLASRVAVAAVLILNAACLILTFERSFWIASVAGFALILARAYPSQRIRTILWTPIVALAAFLALSTLSPETLTTAQQRLLSLGEYQSDESVRYRVVETSFVLEKVLDQPLTGSGLAATIFIGEGSLGLPAESRGYAHNGYAWLAWKVGIPAACLLWLLLVSLITRRARLGGSTIAAVRVGAQGALMALLIIAVAFPVFATIAITPTMGLLIALVAGPWLSEPSQPARAPAWGRPPRALPARVG